jgi:hypothetical protein
MAKAARKTITCSPADSSRRRFLTVAAAAASAVSATALAAAAMPVRQACTIADDSALVKLEELIFEQREGGAQYDDEIIRLQKIWTAEAKRLAVEVEAGRSTLTEDERWALALAMPEAKEYDRLAGLQKPFHDREDAYTEQMFATAARTPEGRRAKVLVLLSCVMGDRWCSVERGNRLSRNDGPEVAD